MTGRKEKRSVALKKRAHTHVYPHRTRGTRVFFLAQATENHFSQSLSKNKTHGSHHEENKQSHNKDNYGYPAQSTQQANMT